MGIKKKNPPTTPFQPAVTLLTYALNADKQLVNINDVVTGINCKCVCPACNEPLIAKNKGQKRKHHFAHQSGTECKYAVESMLHILAKEKIREAFLSKSEYLIRFEYKSFCTKFKDCKFIRYDDCYKKENKTFNLKKYDYDSCEQEIAYDNIKRRSDLKFFSSKKPNLPPIYLEFYVTHASDSEKLHSKNRIIEIKIETINDILQLSQNGIIESNNEIDIKNGNSSQKVCFYGFQNKDFNNEQISNEIEIAFVRYILYKSGKSQCFQDTCKCKKLTKSKPFSLLEICIHTDISFGINEEVKYIGFQKFKIKNCILCVNYVDNYNGNGKICRLHKSLQIPHEESFDTARAKECPYFKVNKQEMDSVIKNGLSKSYKIL